MKQSSLARADVVVVGSGGGALVGACRAADQGARVLVLERSELIGGTTAISGGVLWAPTHHRMGALGVEDSYEEAFAYLRASTGPSVPDSRIEWFVRTAPIVARYLADETHVRLAPVPRLDYHSELPGAKVGRALDNLPFDVRAHPGLEERLRTPIYFPPVTIVERDLWQGAEPDGELIAQRQRDGIRTLGGALIGALIVSAEERGVEIRTGCRAVGLIVENGRVVGVEVEVEVETGDGRARIDADHGVLLASGGFEWSRQLQEAFLPAPVTPITPPHNEGDGLIMAMGAGAALQHMPRVWGMPVIQDPDYDYDGRPSGIPANTALTLPGTVMVNRYGERFVNEARDYHDLNKTFFYEDVEAGGLRNQPAWMIFDSRYQRTYPFAGRPAGTQPPDWVASAPTLESLAERLGIQADGLLRTMERFNAGAGEGHDELFQRGVSAQDRHLGDRSHGPNPCLAPVDEPPFYAVPILAGALGTGGGLVADDVGHVLDLDGAPIPGLFATGNVTASIFGDTYPGAGATISASIVRGWEAGDLLGRKQAKEVPDRDQPTISPELPTGLARSGV